ncbi:MAG: rhodanese-like domain-containing protein [Dermatophilaceae bacterium]
MAPTQPTRPTRPGQGARAPHPDRVAARAAAAATAARRRRWTIASVVGAAVLVVATVAALAFGSRSGVGSSAAGLSANKDAFVLPGLLDDGRVSLAAHAGRPVVVNFFASWCVYCNEELPGFVQVANSTRGKVDFVGIDTYDTGDGAAMARRFDLAGAGFALARDIGAAPGSELWSSFGGQGLPVTAFYNAKGKLVDFSGGMLTQDQLQQRIKTNFGVDVKAADASKLAAPVIPLIPRGAYELLSTHAQDPSFVALDVRTPAEYSTGHLPGAVNTDFDAPNFRKQLEALDKDKSYFVYGQSGNRSSKATELMHSLGFKHVYDIQGGITAWQGAGLPSTR